MKNDEKNPLKNCPFCGGLAIRTSYKLRDMPGALYCIECENCEAKSAEFHNYTEARAAWNKRI